MLVTTDYGVPDELGRFVDDGFLLVVFKKPKEKTVTFAIPSLSYRDENGIETDFTLDWIHPSFNAEFCHYFHETPGDLANFYLNKGSRERGDERIELQSLEDLLDWLADKQDLH